MSFDSRHSFIERADYTWSSDSIRFINTPTLTARHTFFYVQEVGYFKTSPPYFTERANLNSFLIIYTISGKGHLKYRNNTYHLLPGSVMFINCADHHYYECLTGQEWEFLWLHFNGSSALGYFEEFIKNDFRILYNLDPSFMENTLRKILLLIQKKELHSEIIVSGLIVELLTQLLIASSTEGLSLGFMPDYLKKVLKKIENQFHEPISLDDLSQEFNISKYHLSREFKRYIGVTINEYLTLTRINNAKEQLKYSDLPVSQIAYSCGFHYISHFINTFKDKEKCTPLQYRKDWRA